jgi:hypothetical protein
LDSAGEIERYLARQAQQAQQTQQAQQARQALTSDQNSYCAPDGGRTCVASVFPPPNERRKRHWSQQEITKLHAARALILQHKVRPPVPLALPPELSELLQRCWAYEPCCRPTFDEIVDVLDVVQELKLVRPEDMPFEIFSD